MYQTRDEVLYLTSNGSLELFPKNNPCNFTNTISPHLSFDSNQEYEMGLVSILFPKRFFAILKDNTNFSITFFCTVNQTDHIFKYTPSINILAGDMNRILVSLNKDICIKLKTFLDYYDFDKIVENEKIFLWDGNNCLINCTRGIEVMLQIQFSSDIAEVLGFRDDTLYKFHGEDITPGHIYSPLAASPLKGVDHLYIYSDIVQPSYFGGQLVNILDCFVFESTSNKGLNNVIYRPLNTNILGNISIRVSDQYGRAIYFENESTITCIVHIRARTR